jgi:hypothetical protein
MRGFWRIKDTGGSTYMGIDTREVKRLAREYSAGDCSAFEKLY